VTALRRDIAAAGVAAARMLRELADGGLPDNFPEAPPVLRVRESSGRVGVQAVPAATRTRLTA
jgi:hypothetical protein